ncbi:methyltransferase domain-containing protein [Glycomyces sp. L485]|uniref:class I SAM-dependent methyltransferase n=1 Tax=Glycomyces sp. L485 TaxID=2909235 RepID=UPI001F4AF0B8|nr:methyltransferase domain-containing protein [Glycomyces sp. L485]MCH7230915.1 methyltransferase domain-containing protein [Glycomyces sp. L485]
MTTVDPGPARRSTETKACCATAYSSDAVAMLLGESYHPGGLRLTRRLTSRLALRKDGPVLDVACGRGASALAIAAEHGCPVSGVDLSQANIAAAAEAASAVEGEFDFRVGDAEALPFADGAFAAVVCECALCTFPDKATAAREFARVIAPGGRLGITDVTADRDRLPPELTGLGAWIACVADARPLSEYTRILRLAGFGILTTEHHDDAIRKMLSQIEARLQLVEMTAPDRAEVLGLDFGAAPGVLKAARRAIDDGILGYGLIVAERVDTGE